MTKTFEEMALRIFKDVYGNASPRDYDPVAAIHVEFARRLRDELLRKDAPMAWRVAEIMGDHFSFETFYSEDEAESAAGFLGEYWGGTDKLYLRPAPKAPEDYALVPKEPTEAMINAAHNAGESGYTGTWTIDPAECWEVMLAAAQKENE